MNLPGIKKEDIKILYVDNHLNISGERNMKEIIKSTLEHLLFPAKLKEDDQLNAEFKNSQLTIKIPK